MVVLVVVIVVVKIRRPLGATRLRAGSCRVFVLVNIEVSKSRRSCILYLVSKGLIFIRTLCVSWAPKVANLASPDPVLKLPGTLRGSCFTSVFVDLVLGLVLSDSGLLLASSWALFGFSWAPPGSSWASFGFVLASSWAVLASSWLLVGSLETLRDLCFTSVLVGQTTFSWA